MRDSKSGSVANDTADCYEVFIPKTHFYNIQNLKWLSIADNLYRMLITGGSGLEKTNALLKRTRWYWQDLLACKRFKWIEACVFH